MKISSILFLIVFACQTNAQTVYITKTGTKYHRAHCRYLKYSGKEIALDKALSLGYTPCTVCKPVPGNNSNEKEKGKDSLINSYAKISTKEKKKPSAL